MTKDEIRAMINKYGMEEVEGGRIRCYKIAGMTDEQVEKIKAAKTEILAYFAEEKAEKQRRLQTFESIPGVPELRDARLEMMMYNREFNKAMDRGDCIFPKPPAVDLKGIKALEEKYPEAVFALEVENGQYKANFELAGIAKKAYTALCEGKPWQEVKAEYEKDEEKFAEAHMWD